MVELGQIDVGKATNASVLQSSGSIEQTGGDPAFGDFQRKAEDIFNKSLSERAASVVGDVTKGFFKEFFGVKFKEGAVPKEDISSKEGGVPEGNNVSERVTAKKVLKGIVGTFLALPFLIGMGPLYIANMIRFAAKGEDIGIYDLSKLTKSKNSDDNATAISYSNDMLATSYQNEILVNDKDTTESIVVERFLNENYEQIREYLFSSESDIKDNTIKLLTNMLKKENTTGTAEKIINSHDEVFSFEENITNCLETDNHQIRNNTIELLTTMLENKSTKDVAKGIIKVCVEKQSIADGTIELLTTMLENESTKDVAKGIIRGGDFTEKIKQVIFFQKIGVRKDAITYINKLLNAMLKSGDENIAKVANELKSDLDKK